MFPRFVIVQLAKVPLGIRTVSPSAGSAAGGSSLTVRVSGFQSGIKATLGGRSAAVTLMNVNTLTFTAPAVSTGPQRSVLSNSDDESVSRRGFHRAINP
jgi:hypothetical protein